MAGGGTATEGLSRYEHALFSRLDRAFETQTQPLDHGQLASVLHWQRTDRTYEFVQHVARDYRIGCLTSDEVRRARAIQDDLNAALRCGRLPFPLLVYRGVRNLRRTLGIGEPSQATGRRFALRGYCATSVRREVARQDFASPQGALFEILLMPGMSALWIAGLGRPTLRSQGELLLQDGLHLHVYSHREEGSVPVLSAEAIEQ